MVARTDIMIRNLDQDMFRRFKAFCFMRGKHYADYLNIWIEEKMNEEVKREKDEKKRKGKN